MPVQFGMGFINTIPEQFTYKNQSVKHAVDALIAPLQQEFPSDSVTLHARAKPRHFESVPLLRQAWQALKLPNPAPTTSDSFKHLHQHINTEQLEALRQPAVDLEFSLLKNNGEVYKTIAIAPELFPVESDYFFRPYKIDPRHALVQRLSNLLHFAYANPAVTPFNG